MGKRRRGDDNTKKLTGSQLLFSPYSIALGVVAIAATSYSMFGGLGHSSFHEAVAPSVRAPKASGDVVVLSRDNFTSFMGANPRTMVMFFAPWCPHCRRSIPGYSACAGKFVGRVAFALVDGEKETQLARIYKISSYPTLKWFTYGRAIEYKAPLDMKELDDEWVKMASWMEEKLKLGDSSSDSIDDARAGIEQRQKSLKDKEAKFQAHLAEKHAIEEEVAALQSQLEKKQIHLAESHRQQHREME